MFLLCQAKQRHLLGIGALSLAGISLPLVSLTLTSRGGGVLSLEVMRWLLTLSRFFLLSRGSMAALSSSSCSSSSSSTSSPSAVSWSGGVIHSLGTTHGSARPTLAARLSHVGPGLPVNLSQRYEEKWLQLLLSRLYRVPWKTLEASLIMFVISSWDSTVKPWMISQRKVPPGGSSFGFVQYTPLTPLRSWPP